jgi:hypothetical protein
MLTVRANSRLAVFYKKLLKRQFAAPYLIIDYNFSYGEADD